MSKHVSTPNISGNIFTCTYISSDKIGRFSKGLDNYTMHYQEAFLLPLTQISITELLRSKMTDRSQAYHAHINCLNCCQPLEEPKLSTVIKPPNIKTQKNCRLLNSSILDSAIK